VSLRPFLSFLPLFTNVLEDAFSDLHIDHPALPRQYRGEGLPTASPCGIPLGTRYCAVESLFTAVRFSVRGAGIETFANGRTAGEGPKCRRGRGGAELTVSVPRTSMVKQLCLC
jgi:hypothetical protein